MSYSACDFVDSIAGIVNATDAEINQAAEHLGIGDEDSELSDDETFAAWSLAVCNRIERAVNAHDDLVAALRALSHLSGVLNSRQHAGMEITPVMWGDLYDRTNEANAALAKVQP